MPTMSCALSSEFTARARRSRILLRAASATHAIVLATTLAALIGRFVTSIGDAVAIGILVVLATFAIELGERFGDRALRPAVWPARAFGTASLEGAALGIAAVGALGLGVLSGIAVAVAVLAVHVTLAVLARNTLLRPLPPEIGGFDYEVVAKIRLPANSTQPRWTSPDQVRLSTTDITILVRFGAVGAAQATIALADVDAVAVRESRVADGPWLHLPNGALTAEPGVEVVALRHGGQRQILPVYGAAAFAEVLRVRVARVRTHSPD